MSVTYCY